MNSPPKNNAPDKALVEREYRKTATIKAVQWWQMGDHPAVVLKSDRIPWIETLEGGHVVTRGDWIATGVNGEHWPIKPDVFAKTYEPVEAPLSQPQHGGLVKSIEGKSDEQLSDMAYGKGYDLYRNKWIGDHEEMCADLVRWLVPRAPTNSHVVGENERVIPAGMKPWHGGDRAPNDWDGGPILCRAADGPSDPSDKGPWYWRHDNVGSDIIAYTPKPTDTADLMDTIAADHIAARTGEVSRRPYSEFRAEVMGKVADAPVDREAMVMVPVEPTEAMIEAGDGWNTPMSKALVASAYRNMIAARPGADA